MNLIRPRDRSFAAPAIGLLCAAMAGGASLLFPGCSVYSTFPPDSPSQFVDPYFPPMPDVMAKALTFAHGRLAANAPFIWNLPAGAQYAVWEKVAQELPTGAVPMTSVDQDVFSVRQVRISGGQAQVDIVHRASGVWALVTVSLKKMGPLQMFEADYLQSWTIPVEAPSPNMPSKPIVPGTIESAVAAGPASDPALPAGK